jgi:hypothetical protein
MFKHLLVALIASTTLSAFAAEIPELNPYAADIEEKLAEFDLMYEQETGMSAHLPLLDDKAGCYQRSCDVFLDVNKATQRASLFIEGTLIGTYKVSTGAPGTPTPNFDRRPNGRIYDKYSSSRFPGGDYAGLGNMPYAVFISGGFAVHGTPTGNWRRLGSRASHGCIRIHPDNAKTFNRAVRKYGIAKSWITVR